MTDTHQHRHGANAGRYNRAFAIGIALNIGFVILEFSYGLVAHSTALLADAAHNLTDVAGLGLAWGAALLARRQSDARFTYGLRSSTILAALANAMLLLIACGGIAWEALQRISTVPVVAASTVIWVALVGVVINATTASFFLRDRASDLNIRGAFIHMAADAAVSLAVVIIGIVMQKTAWYWLDPLLTLAILAVILYGTWGLLSDSALLSLHAVPAHIDSLAIADFLRAQPAVTSVHDLHIWALSTTEVALTAHLVVPLGGPDDRWLDELCATLKRDFGIQHSTLQVGTTELDHACALMAPPHGHA
ncbi:MAG: cation transporter [Gammaproteobacteria bacterium]|nr:cation transporter [Gammaproteobacteria bacterium]